MCRKFLLICFISSTLLFSKGINNDDMVKASIVKLINITDKLEKRMTVIENKLQEKQPKQISALHIKKEIGEINVETPSFFIPKNVSFIRIFPHAKAHKVAFAKHKNQYKFTKIVCYENIGFWGKVKSGWIYISNPKYGKIVDDKGRNISQDYHYWCSK